jgi:SAM-dependent methyltransferase
MSDSVTALYNQSEYPSMSHPSMHPAVIAASALLAGFRAPCPSTARILEIGCSTGHHILPMAVAYPHATFTAIDVALPAIHQARADAKELGLTNITFHHADLLEWLPDDGPYDYILAHGFLSWVNDALKEKLLSFCHTHLASGGVACISYNTLPGWALRLPIAEMAKTLRKDDKQESNIDIYQLLDSATQGATSPYAVHLRSIILDAQAKGQQQLSFDDMGPINDPCYFSQFIQWMRHAGLSYIGESDQSLEDPNHLPWGALSIIPQWEGDPLLQQQLADLLTGRTFRNSIITGKHQQQEPVRLQELLELAIEVRGLLPTTEQQELELFHQRLRDLQPRCVTLKEAIDHYQINAATLIPHIIFLARNGTIRLRQGAIDFPEHIPSHPVLPHLARIQMQRGAPLVDAYHNPCQLSDEFQQVLQASIVEATPVGENAGIWEILRRRGLLGFQLR